MNNSIPGESGIVHDDVDFPISKFCRLLDKFVYVLVIEHVAGNCKCTTAMLVDVLSNGLRLVCGN